MSGHEYAQLMHISYLRLSQARSSQRHGANVHSTKVGLCQRPPENKLGDRLEASPRSGSKLSHQGTAGFTPCFLPGFHFGEPILDPQPLHWTPGKANLSAGASWRCPSGAAISPSARLRAGGGKFDQGGLQPTLEPLQRRKRVAG